MNPRILLVMAPERQSRVLQFLANRNLDIFTAGGIEEAQRKLESASVYDLALVDERLPDGSWRDLLQLLATRTGNCEMVVCATRGDERLWAEVIQCGAFDLVPDPIEKQEVLRIVES